MYSMQHFSERAMICSGGSNVFLLCLFTEPHEVFTHPSEFLQLVAVIKNVEPLNQRKIALGKTSDLL